MNRNKNYMNKANGKSNSKPSCKTNKGKSFNPKKEETYFQQKTENHATDYFSDQQLAEQNSFVSNRNISDATKTIYDTDVWYPTIIAHAYNPCPSSTTYSINNGVVTPNALSISATKLLTAIIANTGRVKNYTRTDISFLILAIGQFIAMTEFGRRVFGLNFKFADLNRDIPDQFIEACGFDPEDFRQNRPTYLSQFNYWIDLSNQIVIPMEKIPYFRRSRDMYRDVYRDLAAGQTVYHINVPYSTWILDEDATPGTRLRTVNVTGPHEYMAYQTAPSAATPGSNFDDASPNDQGGRGPSLWQPHSLWTFQQFIDQIYAPLVSSLIYSDTFNEIYADLRNVKFTSQYSFEFWHAELVSDDYQAEIKDADDVLTIYHNTMRVGAPLNPVDEVDANTAELCITAWNDVVEDPTNDTLVHNPVFLRFCSQYRSFVAATASTAAQTVVDADHIIMDFKDTNPSLDYRVDAMMNKYYQDYVDVKTTTAIPSMSKYYGKINFILPLYYAVQDYTYCIGWEKQCVRVAGTPILARGNDFNNGWYALDAQYIVRAYAGAASSLNHTYGYDLQTNSFVQANGDLGNVQVNTSWNPCLRYVNGCPILPYFGVTVTRGTGDEIRYLTRFDGNVDNWYKLPTFKLYNMFNHAFQHLFTADGILK